MTLLTKTVRRKFSPTEDPFENPLNEIFHAKKHAADFPYKMALQTYKSLVKNTNSYEELMLFLLEDVIFTSIYATFYETLLVTAGENIEVADNLFENFKTEANEREVLINEITNAHFKYVIHHGHCKGCDYCQDHGEVNELCEFWNAKDEKFFKTMYVGMMTIQFTMEHLIFDIIPAQSSYLHDCQEDNLIKFRKTIFNYVEQNLQIN